MYLIPLILDCEAPYTIGRSLLTLPLGAGTLLDHLVPRLAEVGHGKPILAARTKGWAAGECYLWPDTREQLRILGPEELAARLQECEASDYLLIVEPRHWPAKGYDLRDLVDRGQDYRGVTHAVAVGDGHQEVRERVECDSGGWVRRVQRLYDSMSWPGRTNEAVFCSIVPARAVCDTPLGSLRQLREVLTARHVMTQDVPVMSDLCDLAEPEQFLALGARLIGEAIGRPLPEGYTEHAPGVVVGPGCQIHPCARIVGPAILQQGVHVAAGATLVGPVIAGPDSTVGAEATVAEAVLGARSVVAAGTQAWQTVVMEGHPTTEKAPMASELTGDAARPVRGPLALDGQIMAWSLPEGNRSRRAHLAAKRVLDVVGSLAGLALLLIPLALVAALVKLTSRGPVFFVHRREREGGREFGCIKFRTMYVDADKMQRELYAQNEVDGPQFKMQNDPRVTPLGRWLRATNIDELPQLINVLLGQMSLVGPRPSPFRENQICVAWRRARLSVRPGITGLWQICRDRRDDGDFHQWIFYDLAYVRHFSLWLDLKILYYTFRSMGGRRRVALAKLLRTQDGAAQATTGSVAAG